MRILNDEEMCETLGRMRSGGVLTLDEKEDFALLSGGLGDDCRAITKAQYQRDIEDFIEDLEYHGEADNEPWKTAESFILPMWYLRGLKQLVESHG